MKKRVKAVRKIFLIAFPLFLIALGVQNLLFQSAQKKCPDALPAQLFALIDILFQKTGKDAGYGATRMLIRAHH